MIDTFQIMRISAITNLVFLILVLMSCRCIGFWRLTKWLMKYQGFQKFFNYHCWYWYGFMISVLIHTITGFYIFR